MIGIRLGRALALASVALLAGACAFMGDEVPPFMGAEQYRPQLQPLGWTPSGELLLRHQELYSIMDTYWPRCGGSGLYALVPRQAPRPLVTGRRWCSLDRESVSYAPKAGLVATFPSEGGGLYGQPGWFGVEQGRLSRRLLPGSWPERPGAPTISPDARRVAVGMACQWRSWRGSRADAPSGCESDDYRLYLMDFDGSAPRRISEAAGRSPAWSPDGRHLAVTTGRQPELILIDTATGGQRRLTAGRDAAWSPDGSRLAFLSQWTGAGRPRDAVSAIRVDGTGEQVVFRNTATATFDEGLVGSLQGEPHSVLWSADGTRIYFVRRFGAGDTLWSIAEDGTGLRQEMERIETEM